MCQTWGLALARKFGLLLALTALAYPAFATSLLPSGEHELVVAYPQGSVDQRGNPFFNGSDMSYLLACEASDLFRAVAPVAGVMLQRTFDTCSPERPMPVLEVHGTADEISLFDGDMENQGGWGPYVDLPATIDLWVRLNGLTESEIHGLPDTDPDDGSRIEFERFWSESSSNEVWFYKVINGGHHWPGGHVDWWRSLTGWWYFRDSNQDIDSSRVIWSFFSDMSEAEG